WTSRRCRSSASGAARSSTSGWSSDLMPRKGTRQTRRAMTAPADLLPVHPKRPIVPRTWMDLLSDLLRAVRLSGAVFFRAEFSAPWRVRSESSERLASLILPRAKHVALFHYIAEGTCWADVEGEKR